MEMKPKFQAINGFNFAPGFSAENIESCISYEARDDDIFIVTYPKSGANWLQQILILIFNEGEIPEEVRTRGPYTRSPFLEFMGASAVDSMPRPGSIKTHLPFHLQPYNPEAKYIVVLRNPKDVCVSCYHQTVMFPSYEFRGEEASFSQYFKYWISGEVECGSYFDWILAWYGHQGDPNVLVLLYEDMRADPKESVLKVASFVGKEYADKLTSDPVMLGKVAEKSSFLYMKQTTNETLGMAFSVKSNHDENKFKLVRKGVVGDFINHMSLEENQLVEDMFYERFTGTELETLWDKHGIFCGKL